MKTAVVTGANRGIGLELTRKLLDLGYSVHSTYRNEIGGLDSIKNGNLQTFSLDVRDGSAVEKFVNSIDGDIDLLINNAGVADGRWQSISEIDIEHCMDVLHINSVAPVLVTQKFLNKLKYGSKIVMMSSLMGSISDCHSGKSYAYRASKTALNMFSVAMKNELAEVGISIMIVHPGWVETDMGGPNAPLSVKESVSGIIERIEEQSIIQTGRYVEYDGSSIEW